MVHQKSLLSLLFIVSILIFRFRAWFEINKAYKKTLEPLHNLPRLQVQGSPGVQCQDFRSILFFLGNKGPPAVPGHREEDPTGPRIRPRPGNGSRHRYGGTRPPPVAGGQHPGRGSRIARSLAGAPGGGGSQHLASVFSHKKTIKAGLKSSSEDPWV